MIFSAPIFADNRYSTDATSCCYQTKFSE